MTREEKSEAIKNLCEGGKHVCDGSCPLFNIINSDDEYCYTINDPEIPCDIDRNYDILVKAGLIAPDDEIETENDEIDEAHKRFMNIGETDNAVQHPAHYTRGGIECISAIKASMTSDGFCDYCKGNVLKYLWRWRDKGGVQDLEKAKVYLDWLIEAAKGCQNGQE